MALSGFLGVDLTNNENDVDPSRSPDTVNLVLNKGGNMEKRFGLMTFDEFFSSDSNQKLIINDILYMTTINTRTTAGVENEILLVQGAPTTYGIEIGLKHSSYAWSMLLLDAPSSNPINYGKINTITLDENGKYTLIFGALNKPYLLVIDMALSFPNCYSLIDLSSTVLANYDEIFYTPTTSIGRKPNGTVSEDFEQVNLLSIKKRNEFLADGVTAKFVTDTTGLVSGSTKVWVKVAGAWVLKTLTTHYTVATDGVTFTAGNIPAVPSVAGEDNVRIEFVNSKTNLNIIKNATVVGTYGFNGMRDYMFLGGYEKALTVPTEAEYFAKRQLPLNFGEFNFTKYSSKVMGYSNLGENQVIHCKKDGNEPTVYLRSASLDSSSEVIFPTKSGLAGVGMVSADSLATLRDEPIWLSEFGITALVNSNVGSNSASEDRGFYINHYIKTSGQFSSLYGRPKGFVFDNKYYFTCNDKEIFVADPRYKFTQGDSYSGSLQYEWFRYVFMGYDLVISSHATWRGYQLIGTNRGILMFRDENNAYKYYDDIGIVLSDQFLNDGGGFYRDYWFEYNNPSAYVAGQIVWSDVNTKWYRAKINVPSGTALSNATYWEIYVPSIPTTYSAVTQYHFGNGVGYGNKYYVCISACLNKLPTDTNYWIEAITTALPNSKWSQGTDGFYNYDLLPSMIWSVKCPVVAYWTTPVLDMKDMTVRKTLRNLWVKLSRYEHTAVKVLYSTRGLVKSQTIDTTGVSFDSDNFTNLNDPIVVATNISERKFLSIQFRILSDNDLPFGLLEIIAEYARNNKYRG